MSERDPPSMTWLCRVLAIVAGWAVLGLAFLVSADVVFRKYLGFSFQGADEIGGYVLAISSAAGFSYALITGAHIRIDILSARLPTPARAVLDVVAFALLNVFVWLLVWRALGVAWRSFEIQATAPSPLQTPLIVPQSLWTGGLLLFAILVLLRLVSGLKGLASRRWHEVTRNLGSATLEEEIEYELAEAGARTGAGEASGSGERRP